MRVTYSLVNALTPTAVALGNFDGLHLGHRQVIQPILNSEGFPSDRADQVERSALNVSGVGHDIQVKRLPNPSSQQHLYATVVTFHPHPQEFFTGESRTLLTPLDEKVQQLQAIGVKQLVLLPFDQKLANLSPEAFVAEILVTQLQATRVSVGKDFCFGRQRTGTATDLQAIAATYGVEVSIASLQTHAGDRISSSAIRQALQQGDLQLSNRLLGRPYSLRGQVIQGQQLGRTLGFPTANLQLPPKKFLPRQGVYGVWVSTSAETSRLPTPPAPEDIAYWDAAQLPATVETLPECPSPALKGVMNIGYRPTIAGVGLTIEVHLLDWVGDLYGQTLTVSLEKFLRPEQKFTSLEALKAQIELDCAAARTALTIA